MQAVVSERGTKTRTGTLRFKHNGTNESNEINQRT